jgi:hypothetical protein
MSHTERIPRRYFVIHYRRTEPERGTMQAKAEISGDTLPNCIRHFWNKVDNYSKIEREIVAITEKNGFGKRSKVIREIYGWA